MTRASSFSSVFFLVFDFSAAVEPEVDYGESCQYSDNYVTFRSRDKPFFPSRVTTNFGDEDRFDFSVSPFLVIKTRESAFFTTKNVNKFLIYENMFTFYGLSLLFRFASSLIASLFYRHFSLARFRYSNRSRYATSSNIEQI